MRTVSKHYIEQPVRELSCWTSTYHCTRCFSTVLYIEGGRTLTCDSASTFKPDSDYRPWWQVWKRKPPAIVLVYKVYNVQNTLSATWTIEEEKKRINCLHLYEIKMQSWMFLSCKWSDLVLRSSVCLLALFHECMDYWARNFDAIPTTSGLKQDHDQAKGTATFEDITR